MLNTLSPKSPICHWCQEHCRISVEALGLEEAESDSRVLLRQLTLAAFHQINVENVEASFAGDDHDLRSGAAHGNDAANGSSIRGNSCVPFRYLDPSKISSGLPHFGHAFRQVASNSGSEAGPNILRRSTNHSEKCAVMFPFSQRRCSFVIVDGLAGVWKRVAAVAITPLST